jgi:drug/metabolite transporter (DMT)-like permease
MIAILGGLGAAVAWAAGTICSARAARLIGSGPLLAAVMLVGLVITVPFVVLAGVPDDLDALSVGWLTVTGAGNVAGLLLVYSAFRVGKVSIVSPIVSTEGAVAAILAVLAGERVAPGAGVTLAVIAVGIALAAVSKDVETPGERHELRASLLALSAALAFGASIYATGRVSAELPIAWAVIPPRVLGVVFVALPLALRSRLHMTRAALPFAVAAGICEVLGFASYALGSRSGIAVSAVLASQFAALAALGAYVLFDERLARIQVAGVAAIVAGVAVLTAIQG